MQRDLLREIVHDELECRLRSALRKVKRRSLWQRRADRYDVLIEVLTVILVEQQRHARRIGEEIERTPKARGGDRKSKEPRAARLKVGREATGIPGSTRRYAYGPLPKGSCETPPQMFHVKSGTSN